MNKRFVAPATCGVYIFKDKNGEALYVGKAKSLKARLKSYFSKSERAPKISELLKKFSEIECVVTDTETEALSLENNMIKQLQPPFNAVLRDDKTYPYIKITTSEKFPRAEIARTVENDGSIYFGPYIPSSAVREVMQILWTHFKIRQCVGDVLRKSARACIYYQLAQCDGPCSGLVSMRAYRKQIKDALLFLRGRRHHLTKEFLEKMRRAAKALRFEEAARLRNLIGAIKSQTPGAQKMSSAKSREADIFGIVKTKNKIALNIFILRDGDIIHHRRFVWSAGKNGDMKECLNTALSQFYNSENYIPKEIILPFKPKDFGIIKKWLTEKRGKKVKIVIPQKGEKKKLLKLAERNARLALEEAPPPTRYGEREGDGWEILGAKEKPRRIDAFDVSHIGGTQSAGAVVVWKNGNFSKNNYRKFKIRTAVPADDSAAIKEIVGRRIARAIKEKAELPDLILVDGGIAQANSAKSTLSEFYTENIPVVGLAKREEAIYIPGRKSAVMLPKDSAVLNILQGLRDEAHRFAHSYHLKRRKSATIRTILAEIPGAGKARAEKLLRKFGSAREIAKQKPSALAPVVGKKLAKRIIEYLKKAKEKN